MENNNQTALHIFGFPGNWGENYRALDALGKQFFLEQYGLGREGRIIFVREDIFTIAYAISTLEGQSGTSVCTDKAIIAVHCGGGKTGE
jgi:hypothetical protein